LIPCDSCPAHIVVRQVTAADVLFRASQAVCQQRNSASIQIYQKPFFILHAPDRSSSGRVAFARGTSAFGGWGTCQIKP